MQTHSILFSENMILLILAEDKTQARRVVSFPNNTHCIDGVYWNGHQLEVYEDEGELPEQNTLLTCPYGQVGDRLWCQESYRVVRRWNDNFGVAATVEYQADRGSKACRIPNAQASHSSAQISEQWQFGEEMPLWATRIWLEITNIRAQPIQDISEEDTIASGCRARPMDGSCELCLGGGGCSIHQPPLGQYKYRWNKYNHADHSWAHNPWAWAISFSMIEPHLVPPSII